MIVRYLFSNSKNEKSPSVILLLSLKELKLIDEGFFFSFVLIKIIQMYKLNAVGQDNI